jgi:hypothetical protein
MEELLTLKELLLSGDVQGALTLVEDLEEMGRDDKLNCIRSFSTVLLLHLIQQQAEHRTTRSWEISIRNALREIQSTNKRRKASGYYLTEADLREALEEAYPTALDRASLEIVEGCFEPEALVAQVSREDLLQEAMALIVAAQA